MARRDAHVSSDEQRSFRSSHGTDAESDRPYFVLHRCETADDLVARIYQEDTQDTIRRFGNGKAKQEQTRAGNEMSKRINGKVDHSGSSFDSFLEEEGIREEVEAVAVKRVLAWQLAQAMKRQQKTKQTMAKELRTSRSQLDRLLDPRNTAVTLDTVSRAARVLGKRLVVKIVEPRTRTASAG